MYWNENPSRYFRVNQLCLRILGFWTSDQDQYRLQLILLNFFSAFIFLLMTLLVISELLLCIFNLHDMQIIFEALYVMIFALISTLKMVYLYFTVDQIISLCTLIDYHFNIDSNKWKREQFAILGVCLMQSKFISIAIVFLFISSGLLYFCLPVYIYIYLRPIESNLTGQTDFMLFNIWTPWNQSDTGYFEISLAFKLLNCVGTTGSAGTCDALILSIVIHVTG